VVVVSSVVGLALVQAGLACVNVVGGSGDISGLSGGDALAELSSQHVPAEGVACSDAGQPGGDCTEGGAAVCCGAAAGLEICLYDEGAAIGVCTVEPAPGTGTTWTELYADYFGDHGRASCAGTSAASPSCHGAPSQVGTTFSTFECPPGDAGACYASMKTDVLSAYDLVASVLRGATCSGILCNMPLAPEIYSFTAADEARIAAWIDSGAPNN
jgi:hypothetical protein